MFKLGMLVLEKGHYNFPEEFESRILIYQAHYGKCHGTDVFPSKNATNTQTMFSLY